MKKARGYRAFCLLDAVGRFDFSQHFSKMLFLCVPCCGPCCGSCCRHVLQACSVNPVLGAVLALSTGLEAIRNDGLMP